MSAQGTQFSVPLEASRQTYPFTLDDLPYGYNALEPHIDPKTLQVHHRGHHATYVKKLNEAVAKHPELQGQALALLLRDIAHVPEGIRTAVKDNGGGHLNHDVFWRSMTPAPAYPPQGALAAAIDKTFGSFEDFRHKFSSAAEKHFASGWVALALDHASRKLDVVDLKDHEVVTPGAKTALLMLDVWEHAYYLKYQNRRVDFIAAFWNVVNWQRAGELFEHAGAR